LYSGEGYRDTLVDAHHAVVQHEDVQRLRAAVPGAWHAPLPAEAAGPSVAGLAERERLIRPPAHIVRLRIELDLQGMAPNPWRRIELPAEASFWNLHVAIQNAMGWTDSHLHAFLVRDPQTEAHVEVGLPQLERFGEELPIPLPGWTTPLLAYLNPDQPYCDYQYDFGDNWRHRVTLEAIALPAPDVAYPRCLDGARACPPEDVGGPRGFEEFLFVLADPTHDLHEQYVTWSGGAYDPAAFDAHAVHFEDSGRRWVEAWGGG
jgi:hypothetical protein